VWFARLKPLISTQKRILFLTVNITLPDNIILMIITLKGDMIGRNFIGKKTKKFSEQYEVYKNFAGKLLTVTEKSSENEIIHSVMTSMTMFTQSQNSSNFVRI